VRPPLPDYATVLAQYQRFLPAAAPVA